MKSLYAINQSLDARWRDKPRFTPEEKKAQRRLGAARAKVASMGTITIEQENTPETQIENAKPPPARPQRTRNAAGEPCGDRNEYHGWICDRDSDHDGVHMMGERRRGRMW